MQAGHVGLVSDGDNVFIKNPGAQKPIGDENFTLRVRVQHILSL